MLCRKVAEPTQHDWAGIKRVMYLTGTIDTKLKVSATLNSKLSGYVDAAWAMPQIVSQPQDICFSMMEEPSDGLAENRQL